RAGTRGVAGHSAACRRVTRHAAHHRGPVGRSAARRDRDRRGPHVSPGPGARARRRACGDAAWYDVLTSRLASNLVLLTETQYSFQHGPIESECGPGHVGHHEQLVHRLSPRPTAPPAEHGHRLRSAVPERVPRFRGRLQIGPACRGTCHPPAAHNAGSNDMIHARLSQRPERGVTDGGVLISAAVRARDHGEALFRAAPASTARPRYEARRSPSSLTGQETASGRAKNPDLSGITRIAALLRRCARLISAEWLM